MGVATVVRMLCRIDAIHAEIECLHGKGAALGSSKTSNHPSSVELSCSTRLLLLLIIMVEVVLGVIIDFLLRLFYNMRRLMNDNAKMVSGHRSSFSTQPLHSSQL
jgi:uncharacterized membrane protein